MIGSLVRSNLNYSIIRATSNDAKDKQIVEMIQNDYANESGIIYCGTIDNVRNVHNILLHNNINSVIYYADLPELLKTNNFAEW